MNHIAPPNGYQGIQVALLNSPDPSQKAGASTNTVEDANGGDEGFQFFGSDGFTFLDFLDIINPLQHIPLISTFYRNATGDTIDPGSQIVGGTLFGGPIGTVASIANVAVKESTGTDIGEHAFAMFNDKPPDAIDTGFARADPLANFETAAGLAKKDAWDAPTGAEVAVLEAERVQAFAETDPDITGAEIELLKEEARKTANIAETITGETGAETAILEAEARAVPRLAGWSPSPVPDQTGVLDWARKETLMRTGKRALPDKQPTGAIAALGGWFAEANYSAAASYRRGAALTSAVKIPSVNILE